VMKVNFRVEEWSKFKKKLFDIYEHRIENAQEICGAINHSYMALEEHFLIYWLERFNNKPRLQIERIILEFLISLKTHS
jgi:hypothetical protein